ncbi:WAT1-related protein [Acorus gramineus]|uniref:WAT1-related protein n=1 Tax=Acorus gramineus TaxID=55184 RepID=A0AAV9AJA0_ACOGR|nr:WAT1-related protein [Acorus gramineus]
MLLSFYKGMEINLWKTSLDLSHHHDLGSHALGSLLAAAYCISSAAWLIIQAKMIAKYMCLYSVTALVCLMASVQGVVFALCVESDWGVWRLGFDIRLLMVVYTKGALFTSIFNPLTLVIVAVLGSIFLNEKLHLGSLLEAILIVIGLYMVLWGKCKENKQRDQLLPLNAPIQPVSEIGLSEPPDSVTSNRVSKSDVIVDKTMLSRVKAFIKLINYNHIMRTRYTLGVGLKDVVTQDRQEPVVLHQVEILSRSV